MRRSQLESKYLKTKTQTDRPHTIQKDKKFFSKLYKRETRKSYESFDMKNILDSKEFWKTMRSFLSDKNIALSQISIEKNNRIISDVFDFSEEFNISFEDAIMSSQMNFI